MSEINPKMPVLSDPDFDKANPRTGILGFLAGATVVVLVTLIVGVYYLYVVSSEYTYEKQYGAVAGKELQAIREREDQQLYKYGWIDKEKGIVRIPIEQAMQLLATNAKDGKLPYNTVTYAVKPEPPGGAAGAGMPLAPPPPGAPVPATKSQGAASK